MYLKSDGMFLINSFVRTLLTLVLRNSFGGVDRFQTLMLENNLKIIVYLESFLTVWD